MDSTTEDLSQTVPPEFRSITLASASFFKVGNALDQLYNDEAVKKHTIIATSLGHLIEFEDRQVIRSSKIPWKDISKVVVHHQFHPLQLYIIVLRCQKASLISYNDLSVLYTWEEVNDIRSSDLDNSGVPTLSIKLLSGEEQVVPNNRLLCLSGSDEQKEADRGKDDAAVALAHRLKGGIRHVEKLSSERRMKETYINQKLRALQSKLEGASVIELKNLTRTLTVGISDLDKSPPEKIPLPRSSKPPLHKLSIRQKIVHNKWVIGINVINKADRLLVCNPQLSLQATVGTRRLLYTTEILKTVQRRQVNPAEAVESSNVRVTIEKLDPPVLRPKKRACILGICDLPSFSEGSSITCLGIVNYSSKPLAMETTQQLVPMEETLQTCQMLIEPVTLYAPELQTHLVTIEQGSVGGVPYNVVALIAGSKCNQITLTSLVSPLFDLITTISKKFTIVKIGSVSDMFCFYPREHHPLQFAVFSLQPVYAHKVDITLYTKDDNQALLMIHSLLSVLPSDVNVHPAGDSMKSSDSQTEKLRQQLLAKMKEITSSVIEGFETSMKPRKKIDDDEIKIIEVDKAKRAKNSPKTNRQGIHDKDGLLNSKHYLEDREAFLSGKGDVTFEAEVYSVWRKRLYDLQCEMDDLHVKYLE